MGGLKLKQAAGVLAATDLGVVQSLIAK
jgi:hypothetical protein